MKLIPFLRFGNSHVEEEPNEEFDTPPEELVEPPEEEEMEDEEKPEEETKEEAEERSMGDDDEMLKVFMTVDEEFTDNSGLVAQVEDVPATELLQELRVLASAFGIRVEAREDEAV
jgi:hypothetical protein